MKTEILKLLQNTTFNPTQYGINAREVYRLLQVKRDYAHWIKARINQAGFIENQEFRDQYARARQADFLHVKTSEQKTDYYERKGRLSELAERSQKGI